MRRAAIISFVPGLNIRPETSFTCGRIRNAVGVTPRTITFEPFGSSFFGSLKMMTVSGETTGWPLLSFSMPGSVRRTSNFSFVTQLEISASAPSRITIRMSLEPEEMVAFRTPL